MNILDKLAKNPDLDFLGGGGDVGGGGWVSECT